MGAQEEITKQNNLTKQNQGRQWHASMQKKSPDKDDEEASKGEFHGPR